MKKAIALILAFVLVLSLAACGEKEEPAETEVKKSENALNVEQLIREIGEVTLKSGAAIQKAQKEYGYLTDAEKAEVENYSALLRAVDDYNAAASAFILGKWECIVPSSKNPNDEYKWIIELYEGGTGDRLVLDNHSGEQNTHFNLTWSMEDGIIRTNDGMGTNAYKVNYEDETLESTEDSKVFTKSSQ